MRDEGVYEPADPEHIAYLQAKQIVDCEQCDDEGRRGLHRCDHSTVHAQAAARWMPVIREILGKATGAKKR